MGFGVMVGGEDIVVEVWGYIIVQDTKLLVAARRL